MPIPAIVGLASSATSSATAIASQAASPFAQLLAAKVGASGGGALASASATSSGPQQNYTNTMNSFNGQLQPFLAAEGVDTSQPIVLKSDGLGGLELANSHPDASKIKSILAENPNLAAQFASVQQAFLQLQQANAATQSANAAFSITITGQQAQASFS